MQLPLQITIRDIPPTDALTNHIKEKAKKLDKYNDKIISCRIVVEVPQKNQHQGKIYNIRIDISVPQDEIVINKIQNENIFVAIRDAFNAAERKLKGHSHKIRGEVKNHETLTHGKVARLYPGEDFGFIESYDGRDFYFHRNNVASTDFDQLETGDTVQFIEVIADEGLQANRITTGKHQPLAIDDLDIDVIEQE